MNETDRIEAIEESQAQQTAYYAWVDEARETGHNTEPDVFRAGWEARGHYSTAVATPVE